MNPDHPPPPYGSTYNNPREGTPLVSRVIDTSKHSRAGRRYGRLAFIRDAMFVVFAIFFVLQNIGIVSTLADDVPASQKAAMRRLWKLEQKAHDNEVALWDRERAIHHDELAQWDRERAEHHDKLARWDRERAEYHDELAQWVRERKAFEQEQAGWARLRLEEEHRIARWMQERKAFEQEQVEWERLRLEEERRRKDVEKRRQGVHWSDLWRAGKYTCTAYGTRAYSAHLLDIPSGLDWFDVCSDMPIVINGERIDRPDLCERGRFSGMQGTWFVDGHPECHFVWSPYRDDGCGNGKRRYAATLMGLHDGDDWDKMCQTTPASVDGVNFTQPHTCFNDDSGRTGMWEVADSRCGQVEGGVAIGAEASSVSQVSETVL